jgi:ABC-type sugar transport system permease subunit
MSPQWPERFYVARHLVLVAKIVCVVAAAAGSVELYLWLVGRAPQRLAVVAISVFALTFIAWAIRQPVVELHADHARLPSGWPGRLVSVPYSDIVGLSKIPRIWLTVTYQRARRRRHAFLQPDRVDRYNALETLLRERTRLEVLIRQPAWARPMQIMLDAFPQDEWQSYVLAPLYMLFAIVIGMLVLVGFAALCAYAGVRAPAWLAASLLPLAILAVFANLVWNRAKRRGSKQPS